MIIYQKNLGMFIDDCNNNIIADEVAKEMSDKLIPYEDSIKNSWANSLPEVAHALEGVSHDVNVAIEYKCELNNNRLDFLIYGDDENGNNSLVILELKQWSDVKNTDKRNCVFTMGGRNEGDYEHPSYQSLRYKSILEGFNQYVQDNNIRVKACSYLHNMKPAYAWILRNEEKYPFVREVPVFLRGESQDLSDFVKRYVKKGNPDSLYKIDDSRIRPSKSFSMMFFNALKGQEMFTLDDGQSFSVSTVLDEVRFALENNKRRTIIIKGGPGCGKSVVAINSMGLLIHPCDGTKPKNACYCTFNYTPRTLFSELLREEDYKKIAIANLFKSSASFAKSREFDYDCIFVDEAHRALPWKFGHGLKKDIDEIDRIFFASRVNVWFIDEDQAVTKDDYLTIDRIRNYARRYNSELIESDELKLTTQFRCLGGEGYISFIRRFLGYSATGGKFKRNSYDFRVFDSPADMWSAIEEKQKGYPMSRLLAGYTHDWVSQGDNSPDAPYDFDMDGGRFKMRWNKKVDQSYINDQSQSDRVGSIHTIQGVDMDYAGVIIGKDLTMRNGKIRFDKTQNAKTDKASGIRKADDILAEKLIRNTYMVLLTRARFGTFVYCEDRGLNEYLKSLSTLQDVKGKQ